MVTGLLSAWMLLQAFMFTFNSVQIEDLFNSLGVPTVLIIPLGVAKFLAIVAILSKRSELLKNLAYYGLIIDFLAAIIMHLKAGDGGWPTAAVALILAVVSYWYDKKVFQPE